MFFLSAKDIHDNYCVRLDSFVLPGRSIIDVRWEVGDKKAILDQMEQALINADFASNRRILSSLLPDEQDDFILPEYSENIEHSEESIPTAFRNLREQAKKEAKEMIKRLDLLATIANTDDPLIAVESARDIAYLDARHDGFYSEDFERLIRRERVLYERLNKAGLLTAHSSLKELLRQKIIDDSAAKYPFNADDLYFVEVSYDVQTLGLISFTTRLAAISTTQLKIFNSGWGGLVGVEETHSGIAIGFIVWNEFVDPSHLIKKGFDPRERIAMWGEYFLGYIMLDILDGWWYYHHPEPVA
jgi:hypothetical protein